MSDFLLKSRDGPVAVWTLNRPEQLNAFSRPEDMYAFEDACEEVRADPSIRVVVLTGAGSAFCAGGDVKAMRDRTGIFEGSPYQLRNRYRDGIQRIPTALYELETPIVAAVNGPAIGAGLDLACMCDIRIASETATFAESFVKLGIVPGDGGAWLLPRIVGMPRASHMALTGDSLDAKTALDWTLVTQLTAPDALMETAMALAHRIAGNPGHALRLTKRLLREGQHMRLGALLELSAAYQALAHHTSDHAEAVAAMLEKRPARFTDS
jgi:enoyl-CoA hydratase/carnithine racemase